ncbi:MAG: hypothetical protein M1833_002407 [Piccolia ochrophora]|nr:MAG: hypothetical protein M1833_002407 [Piccolia ochrophora]
MSSSYSDQHVAAILPSKSSALVVVHRPTPTPGPSELLIEAKSIAINPLDWAQRDYGFAIASYPAVLGSDVAGIVVSTGSDVPADAFKPGARVSAFAPCFFKQGAPDYGALQTRVLVPAANAVPLPQKMSFNEGSLLPMAVTTVYSAWYSIGLPRETAHTASDKLGILIWGGASSIGSAAVQIAKLMGFSVYATASEKHFDYIKALGASRVFDYKTDDVVGNIIKTAKKDGLTIQISFDAAGALQSCIQVLQELKGEGTAKLASAIPLSEVSPKGEGVQVVFVAAPADEAERTELFHYTFNVWLRERLEKGDFVPSPRIQVVEGGLESAQKGLDELKQGVSGVKLVLEV